MSNKKTRILLADDHAVVRNGFRMILSAQSDMEVVDEVANGREAVERSAKLQPDVVIMDVTMPELNGIEATRRLGRSPRAPAYWRFPCTKTQSMSGRFFAPALAVTCSKTPGKEIWSKQFAPSRGAKAT